MFELKIDDQAVFGYGTDVAILGGILAGVGLLLSLVVSSARSHPFLLAVAVCFSPHMGQAATLINGQRKHHDCSFIFGVCGRFTGSVSQLLRLLPVLLLPRVPFVPRRR